MESGEPPKKNRKDPRDLRDARHSRRQDQFSCFSIRLKARDLRGEMERCSEREKERERNSIKLDKSTPWAHQTTDIRLSILILILIVQFYVQKMTASNSYKYNYCAT